MFILNEHTGVLIKKAARLFERVANQNLEELGVTYSQTIFLVRLWERDGQTQKELTQSAGLKQPSSVDILNKMERDGLLTRERNTTDKRCFHFFLTEKAKHACTKLEQQGAFMQHLATSHFAPAKVQQFNQDILSIIESLERHIDALK